MTRTSALAFRITDDMKAALVKAAADDARSVSSLVVKVLGDWLTANGYSEKAKPAKNRRAPARKG